MPPRNCLDFLMLYHKLPTAVTRQPELPTELWGTHLTVLNTQHKWLPQELKLLFFQMQMNFSFYHPLGGLEGIRVLTHIFEK